MRTACRRWQVVPFVSGFARNLRLDMPMERGAQHHPRRRLTQRERLATDRLLLPGATNQRKRVATRTELTQRR
jgi:hypothetical protein